MSEGEPQFQSAGCARRDQRDGARVLYRARAECWRKPVARHGSPAVRANIHVRQASGCLICCWNCFPRKFPRACRCGRRDLERLVVGAIVRPRTACSNPREVLPGRERLTVAIGGLPATQKDRVEENERSAGWGAGKSDPGLPEIGRRHAGAMPAAQRRKGRFLCCHRIATGKPGRRLKCWPEIIPDAIARFAMAEIHALGRRKLPLGPAAAFNSR